MDSKLLKHFKWIPVTEVERPKSGARQPNGASLHFGGNRGKEKGIGNIVNHRLNMQERDLPLTVWTDRNNSGDRVFWVMGKEYPIPPDKAIHYVRNDLRAKAQLISENYETSSKGRGRLPHTFIVALSEGEAERHPGFGMALRDNGFWHEVVFIGSSVLDELGATATV